MAELFYVGAKPVAGQDTENVVAARNQLALGVSRTSVAGRIADTVAGNVTGNPDSAYATKNYVDQQDGLFTDTDYYTRMDKLLTPVNAKPVGSSTAPNGVASMVNGMIPLSQIPVMGVGIFKGPIPVTASFNANTFDVPVKIAEWKINKISESEQGVVGMACVPWAFLSATVLSEGGLPVIEIKAGDPIQTTYESQTLVAYGYGRSYYHDWQTVPVFPTDPDINKGQSVVLPGKYQTHFSYPVNYKMVLTAWLRDDAQGIPHQKVTSDTKFIFGSAFLAKMAL